MPTRKIASQSFSLKLRQSEQCGISLIELAVTVIVASAILSVSLGLIVTQRRQYINQQANTNTNQNLQAAMDMIGNDIRQVGERINNAGTRRLPVIRILDGGANPDTLVLQRNLLDTSLNVCLDVNAGTPATIPVSRNPSDADCKFSNGNASPLPDDLDQWQDYRCQLDGVAGCQNPPGLCKQLGGTNNECSWAYIYDPEVGRGEFFVYSGEEGPIGNYYNIRMVWPPGTSFVNNYPVANKPQLYLLEQRIYSLSNADSKGDRNLNLQLRDSKDNITYNIVNRLRDFQVQGLLSTGLVAQFNNNNSVPPTYADWQTLQAIQISLSATNSAPDSPPVKNFTSRFYPRNSLSRP